MSRNPRGLHAQVCPGRRRPIAAVVPLSLVGLGALAPAAFAQAHSHTPEIPQVDMWARVEVLVFVVAVVLVLRAVRTVLTNRPWTNAEPGEDAGRRTTARRVLVGLVAGACVGLVAGRIAPHQHLPTDAGPDPHAGHAHAVGEIPPQEEEGGGAHLLMFLVIGSAVGAVVGQVLPARLPEDTPGPDAPPAEAAGGD